MVKGTAFLTGVAAIALMVTTAAQAAIFTTATPNTGGGNLMLGTSTPTQTVLTNFDAVTIGSQPSGFSPATGVTPGGGVVSPGNASLYASPVGDNTPFYAVAYNPAGGPAVPATDTLALANTHNYFGLYWGSIDAYNEITFLFNDVPVAGGYFTGADFLPAGGNQFAANTNEYIDFVFTNSEVYNGVRFSTSQLNFEFDNVRVDGGADTTRTDVPEPASLALLGTALVGSLGVLRRRRKDAI